MSSRALPCDLHLDIGDVRDGIDRQLLVVVNAERADDELRQQNEPASADGELDEFVEHMLSGRGSRRL